LYRFLRFLILWPGWLGHNWQARRRMKGERALSLGMVAFAAGDHKLARQQARKAEKLLGSGLLSDLLSAQAAHASGDTKAAMRYFTTLSRHEDTAYFGHLGLMRLYQEQGQSTQSLEAAHKALAQSGPTSPAMIRVFADDLEQARWGQALDKLTKFMHQDNAGLSRLGPADGLAQGQLAQPALLAAHLCVLLSETEEKDRQKYLEQALNHTPKMVEAARRLAVLRAESHQKAALKQLETNFKACPHPILAELIAKLSGDNDGQLIARLSALAEAAQASDEARLIAAEQALKRGIWASASALLADVSPAGQTNQYFLLVAQLAEKKQAFSSDPIRADAQDEKGAIIENTHEDERQKALLAAAHAPHSASWHCHACDTAMLQWDMVCPSCQVLGQIDWCQANSNVKLALSHQRD